MDVDFLPILIYQKSADALEAFKKNNKPLEKSFNITKKYHKISYDLTILALNHEEVIDYLIEELDIPIKSDALKESVAKILIAELLWGRQILPGNSKDVKTIKDYEDDLRETFMEAIIANYKLIGNKLPCRLPVYIRINTLNKTVEDNILQFQNEGWKLLPFCNSYSDHVIHVANIGENEFMRDYHIREVLVFPPGTNFRNHYGLFVGNYFIQDKGSCLASYLLNPKPDSTVLDMCAAPGIKTNHIANIMNNEGKIFATDKHPSRYERLCDTLELSNVLSAETMKEDLFKISHRLGAEKDQIKYILLDPSCTYSGIFYKTGSTKKEVRLQHQHSLMKILKWTLCSFPNVRRVVYTTCSLYAEEGEMVVDAVLKDLNNSYNLLNVKEMLRNEWQTPCIPGYHCSDNCLRTYPGHDGCQGYFIAVLERNPSIHVPRYIESGCIINKLQIPCINYAEMENEIAKEFTEVTSKQIHRGLTMKRKFIKTQTPNKIQTQNKFFANKRASFNNFQNTGFTSTEVLNKRFKSNFYPSNFYSTEPMPLPQQFYQHPMQF